VYGAGGRAFVYSTYKRNSESKDAGDSEARSDSKLLKAKMDKQENYKGRSHFDCSMKNHLDV
jgi:hypothetical protein